MKIIYESKNNRNLDDATIESIISKYGRFMPETAEVYISDKGNLVFQAQAYEVYANKELVKKNFKQFKAYLETLENLSPYKRHCEKEEIQKKYHDCYKGNTGNVVYKNRKYIIKQDGTCYYVDGKRIRRVAKENRITYFKNFIKCYINPTKNISPEIFKFLIDAFSKEYPYLNSISPNYKGSFSDFLRYFCGLNLLNDNFLNAPKSIKKLIVGKSLQSASELVYGYDKMKKLGFKDVNLIRYTMTHFNAFWFTGIKRYFLDLKEFYKGTNNNPEKVLIDRLKTSCFAKDTFMMYNRQKFYERKYSMVKKMPKNFLKLNLDDAHKRLSELIRANLALIDQLGYDYSNDVKSFEKEYEGYNFALPKNSKELVRLSEVMSNCVAGYNQKIRKKSSIILYAYKDKRVDDYIKGNTGDSQELKSLSTLCIELSPFKKDPKGEFDPSYYTRYDYKGFADNVVRQCFAYGNQYPNDKDDKVMYDYFKTINYHYVLASERRICE